MPPPLGPVLETCLYVDDLDAALGFYRDILGLRCLEFDRERHAFFDLEPGNLLLFLPASSAEGGSVDGQLVPPHGATGPGHVAFTVDAADVAPWRAWLEAQDVAIESDLDWPQGGRSLYFRDPAGNSLELTEARIWRPIEDDAAKPR